EKNELKDTFREIADPENDIIKTENPNTKSRIFDKRLEDFQRFISENYKDLMDLAKPSLDKEIKIPPSILSKYFLKMLNSDEFKEDINNYLSNGNIGPYKAFLDALNEGLKEGTLLSTDDKNQKYFKGGLISKEELQSMEKGDLKECYLTNFQSYTTDNDLSQEDLENLIKENKNTKLCVVKFIINEIKDKDMFINNIDNSGIAEDEVMFLPFSAFKVEKVKKMKEYSEVYLNYLGVYNNTYKTEDTLSYDLLKKDTSYDNFEELQSTKETVCEVKLKNKKSNGTFVNIPIGECPLKFLLTDGDLINEEAVNENSEIELNLNEGKKVKIKLDDLKREIYQMNFKKDNLTAIEILKEDNLEDDLFLDTDELNTEDILSNDFGKEPSFGKISSSPSKKDPSFTHDLKDISPFSPILDFNSLKAVGIQSKEDSKGILLSEITKKINDSSEKNAKIPSGNCILADYEINPESSYKNKELSKLRKNILGNVSSYETFNELNGRNCKLYVDGERKEFTKEIPSNGKHKVKFVIDPSFVLEDASYMYYGCISLTHIDFSHFDTSNLKNIKNIFGLCEKLKELDLTNFTTEKVEDMSGMLSGCKKLSALKLSEKFNTEKVKDFSFMFNDCSSLKDIPLDNFNTKEAENMKAMFNNCNDLKSLKFPEEFKTDKVKDFSLMFKDCSSLEDLDLSPLDAKNAEDVSEMFNGCKYLKELKVPQNFTPDKIKNEKIFNDCDELNKEEVLKILNMECLFEEVKKKEDFEGIIKKNKKVVIFPYEYPNYELLKLLNLFADEYKDIKFLSLPFGEETKDLFKKYKLSKAKKIYLYENGTEKRKDDFDENEEDYYEVSHDLNLFSDNKSENFKSETHPHPLIKMLFAYFKCDICKRESSKDGLSVVYRCPKCRYDLCLKCINQQKTRLIMSKLLLLNKKKK
ncbi:MAG: BspA family leucine-rich repeat surface protein, partial [archaeon]|nr:BspA family leucine-rich repeat surface protein [archaeon]